METEKSDDVSTAARKLANCMLDENLNENEARMECVEEEGASLETGHYQPHLNLDTLPIEVFLHICSFLDSGFLLQNVSLVCKHFYSIMSNEKTWKIRQERRWGRNGKYPAVPVDEESYPWSRACWKREEQLKLWGNGGVNLRYVHLQKHIACVDAVHLFEGGKFLATGSRDRSIVVWDVEKALGDFQTSEKAKSSSVHAAVPNGDPTSSSRIIQVTPVTASNTAIMHHNPTAHKGWIWAFASNRQYLMSASWDNTVRIWDKEAGFKQVGELSTQRVACLCLAMTENLIVCGTYDKKVLMYDPRDGNYNHVGEHRLHKKCVLALGVDDTRIISCSEDGSTINYDIRAQKMVKAIKLPDEESYPSCLSFRREDPLFYLGDRKGRLHLVNSDAFEIVQTYDIGNRQIVQGVFHGLGSVMSCSREGYLRVREPSSGLQELATMDMKSELPGVHSINNTVALAGGDSIVRLLAPKENF